jgi:hypothetical protein
LDARASEQVPRPPAPVEVAVERASRRYLVALAVSCTVAIVAANGAFAWVTRSAIVQAVQRTAAESRSWREGQQLRLLNLDAYVREQFAAAQAELKRIGDRR